MERQRNPVEPNLTDFVTDETPEPDPATFDLDAWIGGVTGTVRAVTLYQRSDLLAVIDQLERDLRIAETVPAEDRGLGDATPDSIRARIEHTLREFEASALVFKIQGRSDDARDRIAKRLKKQGVTDENTVVLHQLADAIIEPAGVTPEKLRRLQEASEPQVKLLLTAAALAHFQPPKVDTAFLLQSSNNQGRRGRS